MFCLVAFDATDRLYIGETKIIPFIYIMQDCFVTLDRVCINFRCDISVWKGDREIKNRIFFSFRTDGIDNH